MIWLAALATDPVVIGSAGAGMTQLIFAFNARMRAWAAFISRNNAESFQYY